MNNVSSAREEDVARRKQSLIVVTSGLPEINSDVSMFFEIRKSCANKSGFVVMIRFKIPGRGTFIKGGVLRLIMFDDSYHMHLCVFQCSCRLL